MNKIKTYNSEIMTKLRESAIKAELIADFKKTNEGYLELMEKVKEAQAAAKEYLEKFENAGEVIQEKKELDKEIKLAIQAAAEGTEYEEKDMFKVLTSYFKDRAKDKVKEKIDLGKEFFVLDDIVDGE